MLAFIPDPGSNNKHFRRKSCREERWEKKKKESYVMTRKVSLLLWTNSALLYFCQGDKYKKGKVGLTPC
jgi:hypothetical protein